MRIDVTPVAKGRPRFTKNGRAYTPQKTRNAEDELRYSVMDMKPSFASTDALRVVVTFYLLKPKSTKRKYPTVRSDLDNFLKYALDGCNGYLWHDDAQIVSIEAHKRYGEPHIEIDIEVIE